MSTIICGYNNCVWAQLFTSSILLYATTIMFAQSNGRIRTNIFLKFPFYSIQTKYTGEFWKAYTKMIYRILNLFFYI